MFRGTEVTVNPGCIACTLMQQDLIGCKKKIWEGELEQGMSGVGGCRLGESVSKLGADCKTSLSVREGGVNQGVWGNRGGKANEGCSAQDTTAEKAH